MAKKRGKKKTALKRRVLRNAATGAHFWMIDGSSIKNLLELADKLDKMSDDAFHYHVTEAKNDFSNWINDVFDEKGLAKEFKRMKSRVDAQICVLKHIVKELSK